MGEGGQEEGWVICRVFKKKNQKTAEGSPMNSTTWSVASLNPCNEAGAGTLEQMLQSINDTQSRRNHFLDAENNNRRFLKLPSLYDSYQPTAAVHVAMLGEDDDLSDHPTFVSDSEIQDWAALDRLVASHLNGPTHSDQDEMVRLQPNKSTRPYAAGNDYQNEAHLWSFPASSNDHLCHLSNVPI